MEQGFLRDNTTSACISFQTFVMFETTAQSFENSRTSRPKSGIHTNCSRMVIHPYIWQTIHCRPCTVRGPRVHVVVQLVCNRLSFSGFQTIFFLDFRSRTRTAFRSRTRTARSAYSFRTPKYMHRYNNTPFLREGKRSPKKRKHHGSIPNMNSLEIMKDQNISHTLVG